MAENRKLTEIFPTKPCTRCGGGGRYSYNQRDGDRCWGCSGTGQMWATKKVSEAVVAYRKAVKDAKERQVKDLELGVKIYWDGGVQCRVTGTGEWVEVVALQQTGDWSGKSGDTVTSWFTLVSLANGETVRMAGNQIVRTFNMGVSVEPFLEMTR